MEEPGTRISSTGAVRSCQAAQAIRPHCMQRVAFRCLTVVLLKAVLSCPLGWGHRLLLCTAAAKMVPPPVLTAVLLGTLPQLPAQPRGY
jgi:hypothetical protein